MGRLIDADILIAELKESALHHCNNARDDSLLQRDRVIVRAQPTVEAIPKAEYEKRLKADMVAILDKIRAEIEKAAFDDVNGSKFIFVNRVNQIIDKYKAESEGENDKT